MASAIVSIKLIDHKKLYDGFTGGKTHKNELQFSPPVFSQTGQVYGPFKSLIKEQIRQYLIDFEGHAKTSKIK